jgi:hypothetical protein
MKSLFFISSFEIETVLLTENMICCIIIQKSHHQLTTIIIIIHFSSIEFLFINVKTAQRPITKLAEVRRKKQQKTYKQNTIYFSLYDNNSNIINSNNSIKNQLSLTGGKSKTSTLAIVKPL